MSSILGSSTPNTPLFDSQNNMTLAWRNWFRAVTEVVNKGFDPDGTYQGPIGARATIVGRQFLATIVQHLSDIGVIDSAGLPSATDTAQGAVILPAGAVGHTLGSAAMQPVSAFDASGSAAAAQTAAETHADTVAATAQSNAETFATAAIATAFAPGISVTVVTAALTLAGTQGSMDFVDGLLVSQVQAT